MIGDRADERADRVRGRAADTRVDLVEHVGRDLVGAAQRQLHRQHDARQLAARRDLGQGLQLLTLVGAEQHLDLVGAVGPEGRRRDPHLEARRRHAELAERLADLAREPGAGLLAAVGERGGGALAATEGLGAGGGQALEVRVAVGQRVELGGQRGQALEQLGPTVLAPQPTQELEAVVDPRQALGIAVDAIGVAAQRGGGVVGHHPRLGELARQRIEAGVEPHQLVELARGVGQAIERAAVAVATVERRHRGPGAEPQLLGRRQPGPLADQALVLAALELGAVELVLLEPHEVGALGALAIVAAEVGDLRVDAGELVPRRAHLERALGIAGERVEDLAVARGVDQALVLVLPGQIDQPRAQLGQAPGGGERAVDVGAALAAALDDPADHDLGAGGDVVGIVRGERQPGGGQDRDHAAAQIRRHLDDGLDRGLGGAGARDVGRGATAAQEVHRLDDERLAGAGLAGEHAEPGAELDRDVRQDGEVGDSQVAQHASHSASRP